MFSEGKIGVQEAICLVVIATGNRVFFTAPAVVSQAVGNAGWYMSLISTAFTLVSFTFVFLLLKRFPGRDILEIFKVSFGRFIGFLFCLIYTGSFLAATGILQREFFEMLKTFVFPNTPISVLNGAMVLLASIIGYLGLEAIARVAKLAAMIALFGYITLLLLSIQNYKLSNLSPILGYGLGKTVWEGVTRSSAFSEVIILAVFAGSLQGIHHIKRAGYLSILYSGLVISVGIFCLTLVFPYYSLQENTAPLYTLATLINYGAFSQRLDPAFLFMWMIITGISSSIVFYTALSSFCKTFGLQDKRPVIPPMAVLLFAITIIPSDLPAVINQYIEILRVYPIFLFYILPLITLLTALVRKKKGGAFGVKGR